MANMFFFSEANSHVFISLCFTTYDGLSLYVLFESFQPACLAQECLVWRSSSIFLSIIWPDLSGVMRKVCCDQTFCSGRQYSVCCLFMLLWCSGLTYIYLSSWWYVNDVFWFIWITKLGIFSSEKKMVKKQ